VKFIVLGTAMSALLLASLPAAAEVVVRERTRLPNGDVIVKTRSSC
jgi:hypothetical protein